MVGVNRDFQETASCFIGSAGACRWRRRRRTSVRQRASVRPEFGIMRSYRGTHSHYRERYAAALMLDCKWHSKLLLQWCLQPCLGALEVRSFAQYDVAFNPTLRSESSLEARVARLGHEGGLGALGSSRAVFCFLPINLVAALAQREAY
jgi:hypothetical protein